MTQNIYELNKKTSKGLIQMNDVNKQDPLGLGNKSHVNNVKYIPQGLIEGTKRMMESLLLSKTEASPLLTKILRDEYSYRMTGLYNLARYVGLTAIEKLRSKPNDWKSTVRTKLLERMNGKPDFIRDYIMYNAECEAGLNENVRPSLSNHYYQTNAQVTSLALFRNGKEGDWTSRVLYPVGIPVPIHCQCCSSRRKMDKILEAEMANARLAIKGGADPGYIKHVEACSPLHLNAFGWGRMTFWRVKDSKRPDQTGWSGRILCNSCYMRATRAPEEFLKFIQAATGPTPQLSIPIPPVENPPKVDRSGERKLEIPANLEARDEANTKRESTLIELCTKHKQNDLLTSYKRQNGQSAVKLRYSKAETQEALTLLGLMEVS